jgi:DegV family protein with EDD domain
MSPVTVVTDTCTYLPAELCERYGIHVVSLYVNYDGGQHAEASMPDFDAYYDHLIAAAELPTTSQPSIGDFLAVYEPLIERGDDVVSIHLSGGISGTVESARQARAALVEQGVEERRIEIVDSVTAAGGQGLIVLGAAAAARAGAGSEAVAARAREARDFTRIWFCVDTLDFLRRGGRIGAARAWIGSTLRIKPILTLEQEITPVERVRTAGRAFERMADYLRALHDDGADAWCIQHVQAPDEAQRMVERGREIFGTDPQFVSEVGPVIGTHVGPGLLGVGGMPSRFLSEG